MSGKLDAGFTRLKRGLITGSHSAQQIIYQEKIENNF